VINPLKVMFRNVFQATCTEVEKKYCLLLNRKKTFRHELAVATMFKNEGQYLDEWINFHHAMGADHFYLYNNNSTDNFREVLAPWIRKRLVTLVDWPGAGGQVSAFNDCIKRFRSQARWIAFLDMDEFLFSPKEKDLRKVLKDYTDVPAIFVFWILFGSNGHQTRPSGSVIENYTRCLDLESARADNFDHGHAHLEKERYVTGWAKDGKSIANPRMVKKYYVHQPEYLWSGITVDEQKRNARLLRRAKGYTDITCDVLRINHYWSRSIQDITNKARKGNASWQWNPESRVERWLERESHLNKTTDETLLKLWRDIQCEETSNRSSLGHNHTR
jgi:glycosyltransferase involved in cell wall biosynthesis